MIKANKPVISKLIGIATEAGRRNIIRNTSTAMMGTEAVIISSIFKCCNLPFGGIMNIGYNINYIEKNNKFIVGGNKVWLIQKLKKQESL